MAPALLRRVYHVLATRQEYRNLGPDYYEHRDVDRARACAVHALERLGVKVTVEAVGQMPFSEQVAGGVQMKRTWTIIGVNDVRASFKWYQSLFGQPQTAPAHDEFGQLLDSDGTVLLCLHEWGAHEHPSLMSPDRATPGNGLLLFFRVDDFDLALQRARGLVPRLEEEPHMNPNTRTKEFAVRDLDGYYVTISAL